MNRIHIGGFPLLMVLLLIIVGCRSGGAPSATSVQPSASATLPQQTPDNQTPGAVSSTPSNIPVPVTGKVTAIRIANTKSGWTGGDGWIARTDDSGQHWQIQYQGTGAVRQLFALNDQDVWSTIGDKTSLLSSKDGGTHWTSVGNVPNQGFLHFVSKDEAFSANAKTTDGGKTWSLLPIPEHSVGDAYFHDKNNGWAVTQENAATIEVKRTVDGGKTWNTVMSRQTTVPLLGAVIRSAGAEDVWIEWIGDSGMTQTSYSLFHSSDGGSSWQPVLANATAGGGPAPGFPADYISGPKNEGSKPGPLYVVSPKVAFLGGQCPACDKPNTLGWTTDSGKTWMTGSAKFAGYGDALLAMEDAEHGWWICTDNKEPSVLYVTSDGGKSWKSTYTFTRPK